MHENEIEEIIEGQVEELQKVLQQKETYAIQQLVEDMHSIDIAIALEHFEDEEILTLYTVLKDKEIAEILEQAEEELQVRMVQLMDDYRIIYLFSYMSNDDVVDILGNVSINKRKNLIKLMKASEQKTIQELLGYAEDTAGGIMTTEYIALQSDLSVKDALRKIKEIAPRTEVIDVIFVLNRGKELIGTVQLRKILVAPDDNTLLSIMNENVIYVNPEMDQEEVSLLVSKYDLKAIPVVNKKMFLLGVVTVDDIIDVIVEEHTEDMLHMGGVSTEEDMDSKISKSVKTRLPWLLVNLVTAFLAAFTVGMFEDTIAQVVALAAAMPIVTGMGGNAGTQTLSLMIRSIALGQTSLKDNWKLVFREIGIGIINGAVIGVLTGIILYFRYGNIYLGIIIFVSMIANLVIAGIFGFLIPLILKTIKVDPALASAIFLTTATDVFGFFVFLGLAQVFLPYLL